MKKDNIFHDFLRLWLSFAKFHKIIHTKFREINVYFRINFIFAKLKKSYPPYWYFVPVRHTTVFVENFKNFWLIAPSVIAIYTVGKTPTLFFRRAPSLPVHVYCWRLYTNKTLVLMFTNQLYTENRFLLPPPCVSLWVISSYAALMPKLLTKL
jgi:hypothetical protein